MAIRAVLFDYGHTLIDFTVPEDALHEIYGDIRLRLVSEAESEIPAASELVERVARQVVQRVEESYAQDRLIELDILDLFESALRGIGFSPRPETVRWVAETEHTALTKHLICPPGTVQTLQTLHDHGLKIGIVSNAHLLPYMMRKDWDNLGFGSLVDASLISSEVGMRKPHPDVFRRVLAQLAVDPAEAMFVGDRIFDDVGGAHAVGMLGILTQEFRQELVGPETEQPDLVVTRLSEIVPYVLELAHQKDGN